MSNNRDAEGATGALGSVRQLEGALEASSTARAAAEARLEAARSEASRLLAVAREDAVAAAAERRRSVLAAADDDAAAIHRRGRKRSGDYDHGSRLEEVPGLRVVRRPATPLTGEGAKN